MFRFLRRLRRYQVTVRGSNFAVKLEHESQTIVGFYVNRWADAFDEQQAVKAAFQAVRHGLLKKGYAAILDELEMSAEVVDEVNLWQNRWKKPQGFVFYPADEQRS